MFAGTKLLNPDNVTYTEERNSDLVHPVHHDEKLLKEINLSRGQIYICFSLIRPPDGFIKCKRFQPWNKFSKRVAR